VAKPTFTSTTLNLIPYNCHELGKINQRFGIFDKIFKTLLERVIKVIKYTIYTWDKMFF
jgi:hypothetical protein